MTTLFRTRDFVLDWTDHLNDTIRFQGFQQQHQTREATRIFTESAVHYVSRVYEFIEEKNKKRTREKDADR